MPRTSTRYSVNSCTRPASLRAFASHSGSPLNNSRYPTLSMAAHEPDGMMISPVVFSKTRMVCSANGRDWLRSPALKAGCPQQVCSRGNSTRTPARLRTCTSASPMLGKNESTKQVMKSCTVSVSDIHVVSHRFVFLNSLHLTEDRERELIQLVQIFQAGTRIEKNNPLFGIDPFCSINFSNAASVAAPSGLGKCPPSGTACAGMPGWPRR